MSIQTKTSALERWKAIPAAMKAAFLCCFVGGFFAHLFAFTNIIPNADGLSRVSDAQQMTISGRWFLHYATMWNGYFQSPAVIGFLALVFLSLAAVLVVKLFRVQSPLLGGLCGLLMSVFPSVAFTFLYMFTASAYFFGMLLAVVAVYLAARYRFGFLFAAIPLACAIGTYQAYLAVAVSLSLLYVILYGLESGHGFKQTLVTGLKFLAFLVLGLLLYYGILKIFLAVKQLTLLDYKGIASLLGGSAGLSGFATLIVETYQKFFAYFFTNSFAVYTTPVAVAANVALLAVGLWAFVEVIIKNDCASRLGAFVLSLILCLLLPLALNLTVMMGDAMPIMRYAMVFAYLFVLILVDRATAKRDAEQGRSTRQTALRLAATVFSVFLALISFNVINIAYTVSATAHRATESFATRLVERVETTPGYENGMEVIVIGGFPSSVYYNDVDAFAVVEDYSDDSSSVMPLNKHIYYYLNDWMNVQWPEPDEELMIAISDSDEFKAMPLYPSDGSVKIIDGRVVVRLADHYRPKKAYEIAYENRR